MDLSLDVSSHIPLISLWNYNDNDDAPLYVLAFLNCSLRLWAVIYIGAVFVFVI